ncbi:cation transport protein ChaC [Faunimonas pinastri]|uniref:glutathione-specific gamma-glutamylcyclotransferase n=1 Tax=Faunimonas pinastri TaxID=1855383 RepID=A0A1H9HTB4_9HYPH|nr:gamma-glutamylcyclotransferase [Faunimonas pinastri]SEQ65553.1 cation transport protein ChaC [Faunimonas pinastri]
MSDLWVFGYGSLIWRPGFSFLEAQQGRLIGLHRALCIRSWVHRGSPESPGLVLGLDRGGTCRGLAFRVAAAEAEKVIAYLREREQVTSVYLERMRDVRLENGEAVRAVTYIADRSHEQYAGALGEDEAFAIVSSAHGQSGPNADYVVNTAEHLASLGMPDRKLDRLAKRLREARLA